MSTDNPGMRLVGERAYRVTQLDPGPVARHTLRRGIPRLHPIGDGTADLARQTASILRRDQFGHKLIDVVDSHTGFCLGVRSPGYDEANNTPHVQRPGVSGTHNTATRQVVLDKVADGVYRDSEGRIIRTASMGDAPLPTVSSVASIGGSGSTKRQKKGGRREMNAPKSATPRTVMPGGESGRITDPEIYAYITVVCKERNLPVPSEDKITPAMKAHARAALLILRKKILTQLGRHEEASKIRPYRGQ